jgi:hypothetical protein
MAEKQSALANGGVIDAAAGGRGKISCGPFSLPGCPLAQIQAARFVTGLPKTLFRRVAIFSNIRILICEKWHFNGLHNAKNFRE